MTHMRKVMAALLSAAALAVALAPAATANPSPPTNGGNGAGKSGQCTGPNADRPASCQSQGGPGNQP
jgi:Spy/CpxP family protein refolding chaperone